LFDSLFHHKYKNFGAYTRFGDSIGAIATDLKKRGFKYLGSTLIYSFLQSIGMINGHSTGCWMFEKIGGFCQMSKTLKPLPEIGTPHIYLCNEKSRARMATNQQVCLAGGHHPSG